MHEHLHSHDAIVRIEKLLDWYAVSDSAESNPLQEFRVHSRGCSYCGALLQAAEEIRHTIEKNVFLEREWGFSMPPLCLGGVLSVSIGMAEYIPQTSAPFSIEQEKNELLRRADAAMYRGKQLGGNRVVVSGAPQSILSGGGP